jgi:pimeloyl-ACP methyl ester carboxylesterase
MASWKANNILVQQRGPTRQNPGDRVMTVRFNTVDVDGLKVFYRSAGDQNAPVVLLLHGFPSASHMFRDLIPELAGKYHVVAPDLPGFGMTEQPARNAFAYTFKNIATVVGRFADVLGLKQFAIYVFDYGAPVGFRLALAQPDRIIAIVSQNGNTYLEGVSEAFAPVQAYWKEPTQANRDALRSFLAPQTTLFQYTHGVSDPALVSPDGRNLDDFYLARPGNDEIQLDLLGDYKTNIALYGDIQAYLRDKRPPVLAIWGKNDPFFIPPGAEAFKRDVPDAEVRFVDSGHFALETHAREIGAAMRDFLAKHL